MKGDQKAEKYKKLKVKINELFEKHQELLTERVDLSIKNKGFTAKLEKVGRQTLGFMKCLLHRSIYTFCIPQIPFRNITLLLLFYLSVFKGLSYKLYLFVLTA